ncbi:MAG: CvpA family protein [Clostridia bacterium]|nr:CvpA family protein [Clostridia bacterium]
MEPLTLGIYAFLLAVLVAAIVIGHFRGFVKTILSLLAGLLCVIIAKEYCDPLAVWANRTFVHPAIVKAVSGAIQSHLDGGAQAIVDAIPAPVAQAASTAGVSLPELVQGVSASADVPAVAERLTTAVEQVLLNGLMHLAAFVALFLVLRLLMAVAIAVIDLVFKLPVLKTVNRSIGGAIGALKGVVWVLICILGLAAVSQLFPETALAAAFQQSGLNAVSDAIVSLI